MDDELDVTQCGEQFGHAIHRSMKIKRCENGYIVEYQTVSKDEWEDKSRFIPATTQKTKVFITNSDLMEFVEKYFVGEPKP